MSHSGKRILLLLPEAFEGAGGIQMFCRSLCLAAGRWAERNNASVSAIVLNDCVAPDPRYVNGGFCSFIRAGKSKARFIKGYLHQFATYRPDLIVVGHISLSPLVLLPATLGSSMKTCIIAYGIEVWRSLARTEKKALERADAVLAISEYTRGELLKRNSLQPDKIKLFPCSLDPYWVVDNQEPERAAIPPVLLTVSRITREDAYKGIDSVIRSLPAVIREFGPVNYRIVGKGDDTERLQSLAERLAVSQYITFTGQLANDDLREQYRQCSLFVMPSEREGFGIVFLEAMAYGKPVIGGAHAGTPSVVEEGETGILVDRSDTGGLAQAIIGILKNDEMRLRFGRAGYERLLDRFTFQRFEANLDSLLKQALW